MIRIVKNFGHLLQAIIANCVYRFPSRHMTVIGVTGTDGKTTTSSLVYHILKSSGKKVAMITTIGAHIGDHIYDVGFHVTTPSSFSLQKYIRKAVDENVEYLILEVTSHGLDQNRVWGIKFNVGVLTNITHEHWDYHGSYEKYVDAKVKLLQASQVRIINMDDSSYGLVKSRLLGKCIKTYSLRAKVADITPGKFRFETTLIGDFNKQNCLAAISVAKELAVTDGKIRQAIKTFTLPIGRQEIIYQKDFTVMIDFAHTPNSFAKILPEVKKMTKKRLIHVFGSAAKRDETKRPEMGQQAERCSDIIILTAEDPRGESVEKINAQIFNKTSLKLTYEPLEVNTKGKRTIWYSISDRKKAIEKAISLANVGDLVLLTGKAHERSMNYGNGEEPWNEKEIALEILQSLDR